MNPFIVRKSANTVKASFEERRIQRTVSSFVEDTYFKSKNSDKEKL